MDRQPEDSMEGKWIPAVSVRSGEGQEVTPDLFCLTVQIVNVVMVGDPDRWALVDAGMPESADAILSAAKNDSDNTTNRGRSSSPTDISTMWTPSSISQRHGMFPSMPTNRNCLISPAEPATRNRTPPWKGDGSPSCPPVPEGSRQPGRPGAEASPGRPGSGNARLAMDPHAGAHPRTCFPFSGSGPVIDRGRCLCHRPAGFPVQGRHAAEGNQRASPLLDDGLAVSPGIREAASCLKPLPRHHRSRSPRLRRGAVQRTRAARSGV